jgi:hypothetical protein
LHTRRIGIVPDLNRGSAFAALFFMSAFQVIAKAAAVALLAVTSRSWLLGYIVTDHAVHFIYRVARNDAVFYAPMPPAASYILVPLQRVIVKTISDFTGSVTFRLPLMLGGSYWLFNLAMSQASVFACVHLYLEYAPGDGADKVAAGTLWAGAGGLAAGWLTTFAYERATHKHPTHFPDPSFARSRAATSCSASRSPSTGTRSGRGHRDGNACRTIS